MNIKEEKDYQYPNKGEIMTKEEALKLMEKKGVFNKNQQNWEKEGQAEDFVDKMEGWTKEEILTQYYWLKNHILYWYKEQQKKNKVGK